MRDLEKLQIPIAPSDEQKQIVKYLDSKCSSIDNAIQKQKDIIDKLQEYRQTVITKTVTCGINKRLTLKQICKQDYVWFDKLPCSWKTSKIKYISTLNKEKAAEKVNYIGLENVESSTGKLIGASIKPDGDAILFHAGDVLFGKLRPYLSKSLLAKSEGCCSGEFLVITPQRIISKYFLYITLAKSFVDYVNSSTYGTKMPRSNWEFVRNIRVPLPTEVEQKEIVQYLDKKCNKIDEAITRSNAIIEKLEEYKKSLIYNAVTGKIDCREEIK